MWLCVILISLLAKGECEHFRFNRTKANDCGSFHCDQKSQIVKITLLKIFRADVCSGNNAHHHPKTFLTLRLSGGDGWPSLVWSPGWRHIVLKVYAIVGIVHFYICAKIYNILLLDSCSGSTSLYGIVCRVYMCPGAYTYVQVCIQVFSGVLGFADGKT